MPSVAMKVVASATRIKIESFDFKNPVSNCGDDGTEGKDWRHFPAGTDRRFYRFVNSLRIFR